MGQIKSGARVSGSSKTSHARSCPMAAKTGNYDLGFCLGGGLTFPTPKLPTADVSDDSSSSSNSTSCCICTDYCSLMV